MTLYKTRLYAKFRTNPIMCQIQGLMEANTGQYVMWIARQALHRSMVNAWGPSKSPNDRIQTITGTIFFVQLSPNDVLYA